MKPILPVALLSAVLAVTLLPGAAMARQPSAAGRTLPESIAQQKLSQPASKELSAETTARLLGKGKPVALAVRLTERAAASRSGAIAQRAQLQRVRVQQNSVIAKIRKLDRAAKVLGRTARATNVVAVKATPSRIASLARDPRVVSIHPIVNYQMAQMETVPYIGATAVQNRGFKGDGVKVGVIDSGIDYTHKEFGGPGTVAAYTAAWGASVDDPRNTTRDGLFPTARVVEGYDFIGEEWQGNPDDVETPDNDPIDHQGHGTHVADILGGLTGVAPHVKLYALRVCSAISTSCSGLGMLEALDWAVDPNGDGSTADHLNVVNMSIGTDYGNAFDDDVSNAIEVASQVGILTAVAAGNGADKPYVAGIPANSPAAFSVAQTQVPSAKAFPLVVDAPPAIAGTYRNTETVEWAPIGSGFSGNVAYVGQGCPANTKDGDPSADPYLADPAGKVALIDRGECNVSWKVDRAAKAGATAVLIGLVAPGDAVSFSKGGGDTFVPTMVIQQSLSTAIKGQLTGGQTVHVSVSSAVSIPLVGSMARSSSRGPGTPDGAIKPEIGAPGASVSAVVGSGTGMEAFGGTSGATPMVAGSVALLRQALPRRSNAELKAVLMNTADPTILNDAAKSSSFLAPITRIGGGEVRVSRALSSPAAAWDNSTGIGALSFGLRDVTTPVVTITKTVRVRNYSSHRIRYGITAKFRYSDDVGNGAVRVSVPKTVIVGARSAAKFTVTLRIDGPGLRKWTLDSGANALDPTLLDALEYDGYIFLNNLATTSDNAHQLHLPWQVLPRLSGDVRAMPSAVTIDTTMPTGDFAGLPAGRTTLRNGGVGTATVDAYSLVGTSPDLPPTVRGSNVAIIDLKSVGVQTFPVPADFCSDNASFVYSIAVNTWERTGTMGAYPGEFDVFLDTDNDDEPDFVVFNAPLDTTLDARDLTWVADLHHPDDEATALFFADNGTSDPNTVLTICGEQIGMDASDFGHQMAMSVQAFDSFFSGERTDQIDGMTVAPLGERYFGVFGADTAGSDDIGPFSSRILNVVDFGPDGTNPDEKGLLLLTNATRGDFRGGAPVGKEAIQLFVH